MSGPLPRLFCRRNAPPGISAEYYLRLEQGRDKNPSSQILDALARALQLDIHGTEYLYQLSGVSRHQAEPDLESAADNLDVLIEQFPMPTIIANRYQDVLAANRIACALSPVPHSDGQHVIVFSAAAGTASAAALQQLSAMAGM